jgi:hypothetical protein
MISEHSYSAKKIETSKNSRKSQSALLLLWCGPASSLVARGFTISCHGDWEAEPLVVVCISVRGQMALSSGGRVEEDKGAGVVGIMISHAWVHLQLIDA